MTACDICIYNSDCPFVARSNTLHPVVECSKFDFELNNYKNQSLFTLSVLNKITENEKK